MFEKIAPALPDAILGLTEAFKKDSNPNKINLGVGVYKDDNGTTPILKSVKMAEKAILDTASSKSYLPISGSPGYGNAVQKMLFGADSRVISANLARTAHTPGGTGALRCGADFLKKFMPEATVWMSSPTWANHKGIFTAAGFKLADYAYYDTEAKALDFPAMMISLDKVPAGDIVLLHVCCHNPTGVDPAPEQWKEIAAKARAGGWIPFLDFAYQGFGSSVEEDRQAIAELAATGIEFVIASSFSKNFGLYQDRTGAFTIVSQSSETADAAFSHLKTIIRVNYSNPPAHGGMIVEEILASDALTKDWLAELADMRDRIKNMRSAFVRGLKDRGIKRDFSFIESQHGMFSFSGLSDDQVNFLRDEKGIYIVKGGRINVAGITSKNVDYLCNAIAEALNR